MTAYCHECGFRKMTEKHTCIRCGVKGPAPKPKAQAEEITA